MMNEIVLDMRKAVGPELSSKLGLSPAHTDLGLQLACRITQDVLNETRRTHPTITMEIISKEVTTPDALLVWARVAAMFVDRSNRELGINVLNASAMKNAVLPRLSRIIKQRADGSEERMISFLKEVV